MIILVIGVAGSGKTTVGRLLAQAMHCTFLEGDSLHSKQNIHKMSHGIPLTDADRALWLAGIHAHILPWFEHGQDLVVGCSALKERYRAVLAEGVPITWVYLKGSFELIRSRLRRRPNHFMKADMLESQFNTLEEPSNALVVDVSLRPSAIVEQILSELRIEKPRGCGVRLKPEVRVFAEPSISRPSIADCRDSSATGMLHRDGTTCGERPATWSGRNGPGCHTRRCTDINVPHGHHIPTLHQDRLWNDGPPMRARRLGDRCTMALSGVFHLEGRAFSSKYPCQRPSPHR